jgi:hypothetical protein
MASRERKYWFAHNGHHVFIFAGSVEFAKEKFQARYGYWPAEPIRVE